MIGAKKAVPEPASKATSALGVLENLKQSVIGELRLGGSGSAGSEPNWNTIKAAREMQSRRAFEVEKYRAMIRR